jgi:drug/metabolite transporter superfamily protein YnfA
MDELKDKNVPAAEPGKDDLKDTRDLRVAIEKIVDDETAVLVQQGKLPDPVGEKKAGQEPEKHIEKQARSHSHAHNQVNMATRGQSDVSDWFFTFMCMNIPIIGWIYLMYLAFNRRHTDRRNFARAYLFYKIVFLVVALIILLIVGSAALNLLDQLLAYMQML